MTRTQIDVTTCQICGSTETKLEFAETPFKVLRCPSCGFVYVTPRYSDDSIHTLYDEDYWRSDSPKTKGYASYADEAPLYLKTFRRRMRFVKRYLKPGARILDVGCAAGYFLRVANAEGYDGYGVEVSAAIAREAREELGEDRVWVGMLDSLPDDERFQPGSFDLVTMWDVIEHVPDPQDLLRQARRLLKPSGHLILETQNVDSRFAKKLGPRWHHFKHEEHIYHFNPATVKLVLEQAGFEVDHLTSSYGGKYVSFGFIAERAARLNKVASVVLSPLALMKRANIYLNFGDEMVVAARPKTNANGHSQA